MVTGVTVYRAGPAGKGADASYNAGQINLTLPA